MLVSLLTACADPGAEPGADAGADRGADRGPNAGADPGPPVLGEPASSPFDPLAGLPPCPSPAPSPVDHEPIAGLVLPDGAYVTEVRPQPPLVQVLGYVKRDPVAVREEYEARDDVEVLTSEDEGLESEVLLAAQGHRAFVKARALCADASLLAFVIAPETAAHAVPTPTGAASS